VQSIDASTMRTCFALSLQQLLTADQILMTTLLVVCGLSCFAILMQYSTSTASTAERGCPTVGFLSPGSDHLIAKVDHHLLIAAMHSYHMYRTQQHILPLTQITAVLQTLLSTAHSTDSCSVCANID
jgi:cell division protein FtsW (lipid II flippase)